MFKWARVDGSDDIKIAPFVEPIVVFSSFACVIFKAVATTTAP
jgi:hypothetical protein